MRLPEIQEEQYSPRQREIAGRIAGKRGKVRGPYLCWLYSPELCDRVEALGAFVRFDCSLPERLREYSILLTARHFDAQHSWNAHVDKAIAAGMPAEAMQAVAEGRQPKFTRPEDQVFHDFCTELLNEHFVSDATYAAATTHFGNQGVVDIIGCLGNFSMLAMCLNAFQVDLDQSREPPYPDIRGYGRVAPRPTPGQAD
jgi:4-carboxymuconolactone decarboxylase